MVAWNVISMGGEMPRVDDRLLPTEAASVAWNTDVETGPLEGLPAPLLLKDLTAAPGTVKRAYRVVRDGFPDLWLALPSPYSSVVRSPLADDTLHRIYWTNPGEGAFWTTYDRLAAGLAPYNLGFITPSIDIAFAPTVTVSGGTAANVVPYISRSYLYTFVDANGLESAPSQPSAVVDGASDGTWVIHIPAPDYANPAGKSYSPVSLIRLYRTVSGLNTGAQYYQVSEWAITDTGRTNSFTDAIDDTDVVTRLPLVSASWASAPDKLDGLTAMPGGFMVGFTGSTLHFCEPNRPHAWPAGYDISVRFDVVGLSLWQQTLMVLTQGAPSSGSGSTPGAFTMASIDIAEPCVARGSIVTDQGGTCYASQNGLILLSNAGMQNLSAQMLTKREWANRYHADQLIACRHRSQYLALNDAAGFVLDGTEARLGITELDTFAGVSCIWNDFYSGEVYMMRAKRVFLWDSTASPRLAWRWRSKIFSMDTPISLGAAQVMCGDEVLATPPTVVTDQSSPSQVNLPAGVNCVFRLYADGRQVLEHIVTKPIDIFRLPSGFKAFEYQFELASRVPVRRVELASTMKELRIV